MSIKNESVTPYNPYGPATGVPTPEKQNKVLSTGKEHLYTGDVTPGTSNYVQVGHIPGGPGHKDCDHE